MSTGAKSYRYHFLTMLSGNVVSQLIPFLIAPILSRLFLPTEFAVFANFSAIAGVIGIVAAGRLEFALPLPKAHEDAQRIAFTGVALTFGIGLLSLLIPLNAERIGAWYNDAVLKEFLWLIPVGVVSFGLLGLVNNWNLRHKRFQLISGGRITQSLINNGVAALFGYYGWGIYGLIIAWILSQYANILVLSIGVNRKVNRNHWKWQTVVDTLTEYRDFPLTNSLHAFTDIFVTQFLLFFLISDNFGNTALGVFAMMNKYVRAPIVLVTSSVSQLFYAEASKNLHEGNSLLPIAKKTLRTSMFFSIPFALVLYFFGIPIFELYLGSEWKDAGVYARILLPTLILLFATSPLSGLPLLLKKQKNAYAFSVLGYSLSIGTLVIGIGLNWKFEHALLGYSLAFSLYYLLLLWWYFTLIKNSAKHVGTR